MYFLLGRFDRIIQSQDEYIFSPFGPALTGLFVAEKEYEVTERVNDISTEIFTFREHKRNVYGFRLRGDNAVWSNS